jgi:apolipoprotein N-acyltransferase
METNMALRMVNSPSRVRTVIVAALAGLALALSLPRAQIAVLAPVGAGALFWTWQTASYRRAALLGFLCGLVFFTISFWWWSTTIVSVVGALAYVAVLFGAAFESLAIAAAGVLAVFACRRNRALAPFAAAAAFAAMEWLRSIGILGVPFAQLGTTQVDTPLGVLGAYVGTSGVTFALFAFGTFGADAIVYRRLKPFFAVATALAVATAAAWFAWPARFVPPPQIHVAAVQGNITQSLKWEPGSLERAVSTYSAMTRDAIPYRPKLIVWPETVIATVHAGLNEDPPLEISFIRLAQEANATIVAGSIDWHDNGYYNALYLFTPGGISGVYDKRQLVPFAEHFPGQRYLGWLPYIGSLNGNFAVGTSTGVFPTTAGLNIGPLICWESAFGDLAYDEVRHGAQVLVIATDDAWFGTSSGPYQHAQIAQMRAIESGDYVVRAAATGISGIISPDGNWQTRLGLERKGVVYGDVGLPAPTVFSRIGPTRIFYLIVAFYLLMLLRKGRP